MQIVLKVSRPNDFNWVQLIHCNICVKINLYKAAVSEICSFDVTAMLWKFRWVSFWGLHGNQHQFTCSRNKQAGLGRTCFIQIACVASFFGNVLCHLYFKPVSQNKLFAPHKADMTEGPLSSSPSPSLPVIPPRPLQHLSARAKWAFYWALFSESGCLSRPSAECVPLAGPARGQRCCCSHS